MEIQDYIDLKLVHEIHTSERKSFKACRRRWDWLFNQSYYPKVTAKPLEFGVAYHKAMEVYYEPTTWKWDREVIAAKAEMEFVKTCEEQKKNALLNNYQYLDEDQEKDYEERVELGRGMLRYYFTRIAPIEDKGWTPVKVEIGFMIAIPNPETGEEAIWCQCDNCWDKYAKQQEQLAEAASNKAREEGKTITMQPVYVSREQALRNGWPGLPVVYAGRLDVLAEDENGHYWIIDWKTAATIRDDHEFLYLDDQIGSYCWALTRIGLPIKGFVYHEQRKAFPLPPKKNKTRRLGCIFSVSKSEPVEYDMYVETIKREDADAYAQGHYDTYLTWLREEGPKFFARYQIAKTQAEIDEIERNIGYEALDMIDPKLRIYPSAGRFGCSFCAFRQPCLEKNNQGDYQYALDTLFERREHYYVRQEASTESKGAE